MKLKITLRSVLVRAFVFTALWSLLSNHTWHDWPLILLAVAAAVAASFALWPVAAWRWRLVPFLRFVPYFLWESLTGGIDVARRALSPAMPLVPALIDFPLRLRSEAARVFFAWTLSLLPGTASVRLDATRLRVHVLDGRLPNERKLRQLESRVAALFDDGSARNM